jgi:hypothetical protein
MKYLRNLIKKTKYSISFKIFWSQKNKKRSKKITLSFLKINPFCQKRF